MHRRAIEFEEIESFDIVERVGEDFIPLAE
jgi:hypothetical protein